MALPDDLIGDAGAPLLSNVTACRRFFVMHRPIRSGEEGAERRKGSAGEIAPWRHGSAELDYAIDRATSRMVHRTRIVAAEIDNNIGARARRRPNDVTARSLHRNDVAMALNQRGQVWASEVRPTPPPLVAKRYLRWVRLRVNVVESILFVSGD